MANHYDEQLFLGYIEGDLAPPEKARFEKMMAEDQELSGLVAEMIDDRRRLRGMPREHPPDDLMDQVTHRLERNMLLDAPPPELNPVTPPRGFRNTRVLAYAGLAAMVLISTAVVMRTLVDRKLYDQDQFAVTGDADQALAKKDSNTEPSGSLLPLGPSVGPRTETLALKEGFDLIEGRLATAPPPAALELQSSQLALGKSKARRERSLEEDAAQPKAGRSLAIAQAQNAPAFELRLPSTSRIRQNRASEKVETFARLTPPVTSLDEPQQAPGDLAQKIMRHLALFDEDSHAASLNKEKEKKEALLREPPLLEAPHRDDLAQGGAYQTSFRAAIERPSQPMQIKAFVPDTTTAQQALLGWAVINHIQIVRLASNDEKQSAGQDATHWDANDRSPLPSHSNQIVLIMPAGDIPRLLEHLNKKPGQSARLIAHPQFWNEAKRQTPSVRLAHQPPRTDPLAATDRPRGSALDRPSPWRATESDGEKNYPQLPVIAELDWGQLLQPRLPFRPVVPMYPPDTPIRVTVYIYKQSEPVGDE